MWTFLSFLADVLSHIEEKNGDFLVSVAPPTAYPWFLVHSRCHYPVIEAINSTRIIISWHPTRHV